MFYFKITFLYSTLPKSLNKKICCNENSQGMIKMLYYVIYLFMFSHFTKILTYYIISRVLIPNHFFHSRIRLKEDFFKNEKYTFYTMKIFFFKYV